MIVYIASYPRCGNSWIQQLITWQSRRLTTSVYPTKLPDSWGIRVVSEPPEPDAHGLLWNEWTALYESRQPDRETKPAHRFIMPGCMPLLTAENRRHLAPEEEIFFIKTHELPFSEYFEGERVIQPVRNAGAACWSYYNLLLAQKRNYKTLTDVIRGDVGFGSWTNYHRAWEEAAAVLGDRYWRVSFEWLSEHQTECCRGIEQFTGARLLLREHLPFEQLHKMSPVGKRSGQAFGWERHYFKHQLSLLWELHGETMQRFGYSEPDDSVSAESLQLAQAERELIGLRSKIESWTAAHAELQRKFHRRAEEGHTEVEHWKKRSADLEEMLKRVEADSQERLALIRAHDAEIQRLRANSSVWVRLFGRL